jgi:hypothetical protein
VTRERQVPDHHWLSKTNRLNDLESDGMMREISQLQVGSATLESDRWKKKQTDILRVPPLWAYGSH